MKKKIILTITVLLIIIFITYIYIQIIPKPRKSQDNLIDEANIEPPIFEIDKITLFSSVDANIQTNSNSSFEISDLSQYTDIAIFITPTNSENLNAQNTLKSVEISNIAYPKAPNEGSPNIYYKNINDFGSATYYNKNQITDPFIFETTSEDTIDYSTPTLYNNCANPITLTYVNSKILETFTLENDISNISRNGSLLRTCDITLNSIACTISFTITIINNNDELFTCPISLDIPLSTEEKNLYDGTLTVNDETKYQFTKVSQ